MHWAGRIRRLRKDEGQAFIELAIAAPVLVFALIAGVDLLRVAAIQQAVQNGARVGAELATLEPFDADGTIQAAITTELDRTPGLHGMSVSLGTCWGSGSAPAVTAPSAGSAVYQLPCRIASGVGAGRYRGVLSDGTFCPGSTTASGGNACYLRVRIQYTFRTIVPWWFVPNQVTVDRSAAMPLFQ